jgi:hypothetical protein
MTEDIVMTDTKEEIKQELKDLSLYQEYRKVILNIEKAVTLKDTKTLSLCTRLLNKFRKGFTDEDCQYLVEGYLRGNFHFNFIPSLNETSKVSIVV